MAKDKDVSQQQFIDDLASALGLDGPEEEEIANVETPSIDPEQEDYLDREPSGDDDEDISSPSGDDDLGDEGEDAPSGGEDEEEPEEDLEDEEEEPDQYAELRAQNIELMKQMQELTTSFIRLQKGEELPKEKTGPKIPDVKDFLLTDEEIDSLLDDPGLLNKKLEGLFQGMVNFVTESAAAIPDTVRADIRTESNLANTVTRFYNEHKDLDSPIRRRVVKDIFETRMGEAQAAGKVVNVDTLLAQVAKDVRAELGIKQPKKVIKKNSSATPSKSGKPALPGAKSGKKGRKAIKPTRTKQQSYMDDLLD